MLTIIKKFLRVSFLIAIAYFVSTQVLNVRSPITIKEAMASNPTTRVKGYTYSSRTHQKVGNIDLILTKPDGTRVFVTSKRTFPDDPELGYFEFPGGLDEMPDGQYFLKVSGGGYRSTTKMFPLYSLPTGEHSGVDVTVELTRIDTDSSRMFFSYFLFWY